MKRKLLNEIDFSTIIPLSNKQIVTLKGGGIKEVLIGRNINCSNNTNCRCGTNDSNCSFCDCQ